MRLVWQWELRVGIILGCAVGDEVGASLGESVGVAVGGRVGIILGCAKLGSFSTAEPSNPMEMSDDDAELCSLNALSARIDGRTVVLKTNLATGCSEEIGPLMRSK